MQTLERRSAPGTAFNSAAPGPARRRLERRGATNPDLPLGPVAADAPCAALVIDAGGWIRHCEGAVQYLFDYGAGELVNVHVSLLLPQLAGCGWAEGGRLDPDLRFRCRIGCEFTARRRDGRLFGCRLCVSGVGDAGTPRFRLTVQVAREGGDE